MKEAPDVSAFENSNLDFHSLPTISNSYDPTLKWYAVRVRSKLEKVASAILRGKGYREFLPLYRTSRRWVDRVKESDDPLFPGYLFCRLDITQQLLGVLTTPGVMSIVSAGRSPVPVSDDEIAAIQTVIRSGLPARPFTSLAIGDRVVIERGPLAGLEGIAVRVDKKSRLVVSVPLLQRSVAVELERGWARPVTDIVRP